MRDLKEEVKEKLIEKGYKSDIETVDKVFKNFQNALYKNGFWKILDQVIEESNVSKPETTLENIVPEKEYVILQDSYIKTILHNQKVVVLGKSKNNETVKVEVLTGRYKGQELHLPPNYLVPSKN